MPTLTPSTEVNVWEMVDPEPAEAPLKLDGELTLQLKLVPGTPLGFVRLMDIDWPEQMIVPPK